MRLRPGVITTATNVDRVMIAPDIAFQHAANTAADVVATAPPYITYHVVTHVSAPSLHKSRDVIRAVSVRTADDVGILQDLPHGANTVAHGFPITPNFDALSYFTLSWRVGSRMDVTSYVHDITPLRYKGGADSTADVLVVRLRQYRADYAADSSDAPDGKTHITLRPYDFVKHQVSDPDNTFFLSDIVIDNASGLPLHVEFAGGDDILFVVDYGFEARHWLVKHAHYEETLHGPLRIGRLHVIADAVYDSFAFPTEPPDPRLAPPSVPSAPPSAPTVRTPPPKP